MGRRQIDVTLRVGDSQSRPYKACPILWRKRGWSTPHPPAPSPTRGEGERRQVRNGDFSDESCAFGQVSNASKPQAGANPEIPDKPYRNVGPDAGAPVPCLVRYRASTRAAVSSSVQSTLITPVRSAPQMAAALFSPTATAIVCGTARNSANVTPMMR